MNSSEIAISHIKKGNIFLNNNCTPDRALVSNDSIKIHRTRLIDMIEGVIGMFAISELRKEVCLIYAYTNQLLKLGAQAASITMEPLMDDKVHVHMYMLDELNNCYNYAHTFNIKDDTCSEQIHSYICNTCTFLMTQLQEHVYETDELW